MKKLLLFVLVVAVIGGVMFFIQKRSEINPPLTLPEDKTVSSSTPPAHIVAFENEKIKEKYYSIDLEYPKNSTTELPEIGGYVNTLRNDFLTSVPKTDEEADYIGITEGRAYVLKTNTTVYTSSTTITYKLETYMFTGGAHGVTLIATFTYTKDGKLIPLGNILTSQDSLTKLSSAARKYFYDKFGAQANKSEINAGTGPKEENFSTWYLTNNTITFVFQQYQIGPYALGIQEFPLSRGEASTMLSL